MIATKLISKLKHNISLFYITKQMSLQVNFLQFFFLVPLNCIKFFCIFDSH